MPAGNGEVALSVFPVFTPPQPKPGPHPRNCSTPLLLEKYCSLGKAIAVHGKSCRVGLYKRSLFTGLCHAGSGNLLQAAKMWKFLLFRQWAQVSTI